MQNKLKSSSSSSCTERELVLIKVRAPPGVARTEISQLAQVFRANIVDVGEETFTMAVTGDPGKVSWPLFYTSFSVALI